MAWQTVNKILGLAMIDEAFASLLLKDPEKALRLHDIQIPQEDLKCVCSCQAQTLYEFSQQLIERLGYGLPEAARDEE
ncbi:MAG TPA: Os1348 family NHLP clan protein [Ktedonobacteraceae bacterium]|nr:Os1348 family NHLP clan protein [Ktedonobacteraceae bacterium]